MKNNPLKNAIASTKGGTDNLSVFMQHIAREMLQEHMDTMEATVMDFLKNLGVKVMAQSKELVQDAIKLNWEEFKGEQGDPGGPGADATVDTDKIITEAARQAATLVPKPDETRIIETLKQHVKTLLPEQELDEEGEPVEPDEIEPEAVVEKINASKTPIKMSAVAGLEQYLRTLDRNVRDALRKGGGGESGGGMGNTQHEQFPVTSATTSITLKYKIAANGFAIWAYYNNGYLVRTTDYTVGANRKTLTFTFTPQDPIPGQVNAVNVVYIRA